MEVVMMLLFIGLGLSILTGSVFEFRRRSPPAPAPAPREVVRSRPDVPRGVRVIQGDEIRDIAANMRDRERIVAKTATRRAARFDNLARRSDLPGASVAVIHAPTAGDLVKQQQGVWRTPGAAS